MTMRHFAITQQGASHIAKGTNCQDFSQARTLQLEKAGCTAVLCGISDGVGSCEFSEIGSMTAVTASLDLLEKELAKLEELTEDNVIPLIRKAFQTSVEAIQTRADHDELPFLEFDATLTVSVFLEDGRVFFGHAGDDGIVALYADGTYEMVTHRHKGEEANSVFPLLSMSTWEFGALKKEIATLAMMTDGVLDKTVATEQLGSLVYLPMIKSALTHPMTDDDQAALLKNHWDKYLASAEFRAQAADDLTLLVAQRPENIPAADLVTFDQAVWDASVEQERQRVEQILSKDRNEWAQAREGTANTSARETPPAEDPDFTPYASMDDEEEIVFKLVTEVPEPEKAETLVVSEPNPEELGSAPVPDIPAPVFPPVQQPDELPSESPSSTNSPVEATQAENPQAAVPEEHPPAPQADPAPAIPQQPSTPLPPAPPAAKPSSSPHLFGQLTKGLMDSVKSAARTVSKAGKRISDRISADQQQRKDSIPVFFNMSGKAYVVADPLLQTETGRFYSASGNDQTMILRLDDRLFSNAVHSNANLEQRVLALQKCRFDGAVDGHPAFIWPEEMLRNSRKVFVGYTLPRIPEHFPFEALWTDCAPGQKFSQYNLKQRCGVAYRLACMVDMANKHGLYVYDFTPQHLVLLPKGYSTFIRTDTFCCPTASGQHAAPFTTPQHYLSPEHLTALSKHKPLTCSSKTDAFSLAVIIYMILSKGQHPFDHGNSNDISQNIVAGFSLRPQQPFPPEVDQLFQAAFGYSQANACQPSVIDRRPSAADWMRVLLEAFNTLPA